MNRECVQRLKPKDYSDAAIVYAKGVEMERNHGSFKPVEALRLFTKGICFVHRDENQKIDGLIDFYFIDNSKDIQLRFICAMIPRMGIGSKLMKVMAKFCLEKRVGEIYSTVDSNDKRVVKFYDMCGFVKYGEKKDGKDMHGEDFVLNLIKTTPQKILSSLSK